MWNTIERLVGRPDPVIVYAGVALGGSMEAVRHIGPQARIFGFEPTPSSFQKSAARFAGDPRIHLFQQALADVSGRRPFYLNYNVATNGLFPIDPGHYAYQGVFRNEAITEVDCTTLDDFTASNGLERVDLLFSDTQGAEGLILDGAQRLLAARKIKVLFLELLFYKLYPDAPLFFEVMQKVKRHGYILHSLYNFMVDDTGRLHWADFLFLRGAN